MSDTLAYQTEMYQRAMRAEQALDAERAAHEQTRIEHDKAVAVGDYVVDQLEHERAAHAQTREREGEEARRVLILQGEYQKLEADRDRLAAEVARLTALCEQAINSMYGNHSAHWDPTGGSGSGCPECISQREKRETMRAALAGPT